MPSVHALNTEIGQGLLMLSGNMNTVIDKMTDKQMTPSTALLVISQRVVYVSIIVI